MAPRPTSVALTCAFALGCGKRAVDPGPAIAVVGESTRIRIEDPHPTSTPWFDGTTVSLVAARGETIGIQVRHRAGGVVALEVPGIAVTGFDVESFPVTRPSTALYGGSHGAGHYADGLAPAKPSSNPAYFELAIPRDAEPGTRRGTLAIGDTKVPVTLAIAPVTLPPLPRSVWAYEDPRELVGFEPGTGSRPAVGDAERACIAMFAEHGVLLAPDVELDLWAERKELFAGWRDVPVVIPTEPEAAAEAVRGWITATRGTGHVPFTIPIDEPRTPEARAKVRALADAVRAAGGGPETFRYAVTAEPHPEFGDAIDLYISWRAAHLAGDPHARWTYNGAPPFAGSLVLDAETPGTRTWGWIGWRWQIPVWYVWDALYWHDRHNTRGKPKPGRALDPRVDPISFDDGEDRGNLDGVLALPGCKRTLRLAALRRGLQDRQLLELAAKCDPARASTLAAEVVPHALADAVGKQRSWSTDEAVWELARRKLVNLASCAAETAN